MEIKRIILFLILGVFIIGASITLVVVKWDCQACGGDGKLNCPECKGAGGFLGPPVFVECGCKRESPHCFICRGWGGYPMHPVGICEICEGRGGKPCPSCQGKGKIKLRERILGVRGR